MPRLTAQACAAILLLPGCTALFGLDEKPVATTNADAGDAGPPCTPDEAGYHNPKTASCWVTYYTPSSFDPLPQYTGASFDGRYVYFLNNQYGNVVQIDTTASFTEPDTWKNYSTTAFQVNGPNPYSGIVFDGRYMYFIPDSPAWFVRYDTTAPFESKSSWTSFRPDAKNPISYQGGTFDGRYVYFAPASDENDDDSGLALRYDTMASFTAGTSWTTFDLTHAAGDLAEAAMEFEGAVFDGTYVYLVPNGIDGSVVARYYAASPFAAASSWELFDTGTVSERVDGYVAGMFDGTRVHFIPLDESGVVMTYDPTKAFTDTASWSFHSPDPGAGALNDALTPEFSAGLFDGRFLYYVPAAPLTSAGNAVFYRQIAAPTTDAGVWSQVNTASFGVQDFGAAVFDGQYAYFAPGAGESFARFDAKEVSMQPALPYFHGSFY